MRRPRKWRASLKLSILTPEGPAFQGLVDGVVAPGLQGSFGVLPGHAALLSALERGMVKVTVNGAEEFYLLDKGFLEVREGSVVILAAHVEKVKDLETAKRRLKIVAESDREAVDA
ncbi:MAG: ATP synthase F1 subunit epsilon [Verrucomicrobia bacterium]|nr:ATP synthase F1 subunit epsilon [Verrucomicrobiota bacterium]MDA1085874.1 ATP synthase F1 subunit epsilon [Verrucomicrobiota bacterium]